MKKKNEFYGVAVINSRGQFVIPKKARDDFKLMSGENLVVLRREEPHGDDAVMLMKLDDWAVHSGVSETGDDSPFIKHGLVKIAERGQIVIPKSVRKYTNFKPGMKIIILSHSVPNGLILALMSATKLEEMAGTFLKDIISGNE